METRMDNAFGPLKWADINVPREPSEYTASSLHGEATSTQNMIQYR